MKDSRRHSYQLAEAMNDNSNTSQLSNTIPSAAAVEKPLRSCMKKSSSPALLESLYAPEEANLSDRGHDSFPSKERRRDRRPSKTLSLDEDGDIHSGGLKKKTPIRSNSCIDPPTTERIARRARRRRSSRYQRHSDPTLTAKPAPKGILRRSSDPSSVKDYREKTKKKVSFSNLDPCRWNSQGSSLHNLKAAAIAPKEEEGANGSNFVWDKKKKVGNSATRARIIRASSLNGVSRLIKQEINRQAPPRPARRGSDENLLDYSEGSSSRSSSSFNRTSMRPPSKPSRSSRRDRESSKRGTNTANIFGASISDFQATVRTNLLAQSNTDSSAFPSLPTRSASLDESTSDMFQETVKNAVGRRQPQTSRLRSSASSSGLALPSRKAQASRLSKSASSSGLSLPSRNASPPQHRTNIFQAQVNDFQASVALPSMPTRSASLDESTSDMFQETVTSAAGRRQTSRLRSSASSSGLALPSHKAQASRLSKSASSSGLSLPSRNASPPQRRTSNIFQAQVHDFQASVVRSSVMSAEPTKSKAPSRPRRCTSPPPPLASRNSPMNLFEAQVNDFQASVVRSSCAMASKTSSSGFLNGKAPSVPSRCASPPPPNGVGLRASVRSSVVPPLEPKSSKGQAPSRPRRSGSPPPRNVFEAQVNDFQASMRSSLLIVRRDAPGSPHEVSEFQQQNCSVTGSICGLKPTNHHSPMDNPIAADPHSLAA